LFRESNQSDEGVEGEINVRVKKNDFDKLMYQAKYLSYYYSLLVNDQLSSDEAKATEQTLVFLVENEIARQIRKRAKYSKLLRSYRIAPADEAYLAQITRVTDFFAHLEADKLIPKNYLDN